MPDSDLQAEDKTIPPLPEGGIEQPSALVRVDDVTKSFGYKVALKNVSFSVPSGQICGLLGSKRRRENDAVPVADGDSKSD